MPRWVITSFAVLGVLLVVVLVVALGDGRRSSDASAVVASPTGMATETATATATQTATPTPEPEKEPPEADKVLLRLTDVPPGYMVGDDSGCGRIMPGGADARLSRFIAGEYPAYCLRQLEYVCPDRVADHPLTIISAVIYLSSDDKASEALSIVPSLLGALPLGPHLSSRGDALDVGDEARVFEVRGLQQLTGTLIAWRNGTTLNLIEVVDAPAEQAVFMVEALGQLQNARFARPLEPKDADTYDVEVPLGCGKPEAPVYWLGEALEEDGLPDAELVRTRGPVAEGSGPGDTFMLEYRTANGLDGFTISVWTEEQWAAFLESELGKSSTSRPCALPKTIDLNDREIEIHSPMVGCAQRFMAHVLMDDAIVTVNVPLGLCCLGPTPNSPGRFDTPAALEAIARALVRR